MTDALALAAQARAGEVSTAELVEAAIRRSEEENPRLNFLVTECYEQALETARAPLPDGPFTGVPMLVKDLTETAGLRLGLAESLAADMGAQYFRLEELDAGHVAGAVRQALGRDGQT